LSGAENTIKIKLADGTVRDFPRGEPARALLSSGEEPEAKTFVAVILNGKLADLNTPIEEDSELRPVKLADKEGIEILRHSTSHVMAQAVRELFPGVKIAIGPAIEDGFYYDFEYGKSFTPEDLLAIEKRMAEIVRSDAPFARLERSREEAIRLFDGLGEGYKVEILNEIADPKISLYQNGEFVDLCRGPHLPSTGWIKAFKLTGLAGAYWRGDEHRQMLQRIYGTAFPTINELEEYLQRVEEAKLRDHRRLGKELGLFSIEEDIGPGLVLWHPKGAAVRMVIEDFWRKEHIKRGYQVLFTPHVAKVKLWEKSGHTGFYRENMFSPMDVEGTPYIVRPMNCPFHIYVYKNQIRSYRELPIRFAELGTVYRYERSGVLHGLLRVRGFTQDDAHIFLTEDQSEQEIGELLDFTVGMLNQFGFSDFEIFLSTRPEKFIGSPEAWEKATNYLIAGMKKMGLKYEVDPGAGVFYGPKIDIKIRDSLKRTWQCSTIQVDFNLPERFAVEYVGEDGKAHQAIMIHRALMGSLERFMGCLIENYRGDFPLWLAPVQMRVIAINERNVGYGRRVWEELLGRGIRVDHDFRREKLSYKIREAELEKISYSIIVGDKEEKTGEISPRRRRGELGKAMKISEFLESIAPELSSPQRKGGLYQTGS
jgi:threonyl-tRNA synthetase